MTEHEREAFEQQFREQAWGIDVSEDVAWEIWQAGRAQCGVPDVSALKYVAECFLENVEEVTELLLAAGRADNIVALCNDLSRIAETAESALSITPPAEHTSDYSCPKCGAKMTQVSPADPDCDALYCNECGFNEPADSENGADIDDGTNPVADKDIDPLFQGPDVPIEDALGAMEEEQRLDNEHFEDSLDSAISGQSKQDRLIDSVNAELCSMAYDMMLSHTISGEWPASEAAAKAKHDQLLAMVKGLRGLKGRCSQHDRGQDAELVFWWDGDMSDLDDCVRKEQSVWHTIPLYTHLPKAHSQHENERLGNATLDCVAREKAWKADLDRALAKADACQQEARIWKQEARTQSAIVAQIYQELTGRTGEPGDWNASRSLKLAILRKQAVAVVKAANEAHEQLFLIGALCAESGAAMSAMMDYAARVREQADQMEADMEGEVSSES